jgi:ATP-dependent DNA helicase DinG
LSISWTRLPFRFEDPADYGRRLSEWIGAAFYERLPASGYQVREEQVYFAFRVAAALQSGRPILAEAGSGTGKTFGYLLPAVCHARLRGRPVVVATATPALQQQLAGPDGDVAALSRLLGLEIDARVARRPEDVVCDIKVERMSAFPGRRRGSAALLRWAQGARLGARSEFPDAADELWAGVAWDRSCRCDVCPRRGYCRLTRAREQARAAADLVVCSHDLFFEDTFGRDRLPPGRLPVLPPFSAVVFDEGHRVALSAQRAAGARLHRGELRQAIDGCEAQGVRVKLLRVADATRAAADAFIVRLQAATAAEAGEGRRAVARSAELAEAARVLNRRLDDLQDEMTIEEGLHEETAYAQRLGAYHVWMDAAQAALAALGDPAMVAWVEGEELWVVPRDLGPVWERALPARTPLVFSSATLSAGGSFAYAAASLGLRAALTARVGVPFRLARQVLCYLPGDMPPGDAPGFWERAAARIARLLKATGGRALILVPGPAEQRRLRQLLRTPCAMLWEGDAAPERLVADFARDVPSCLVGHTLWEGIDVPGEALSAVIVPQLPLPGGDPVIEARREAARAAGQDPLTAVDVPDMALRLKQGVGRLIRTETDRGVVAVLDGRAAPLAAALDSALPEGARRVRTLAPVARFLGGGIPAGRA